MTFPTAAELAQNTTFQNDVRIARERGIDLHTTAAYQDVIAYFRKFEELDFTERTMIEAAALVK